MPSTSFLFPTEHKFPSCEILFLPAILNDIMPLIFQREGKRIIMRHSVSISKFRYLIIEQKKKKEKEKKSKTTTKEIQSSMSFGTKIIKRKNEKNYLFLD